MAKKSFKDLIFQFLKKDENLGAYGGVKQNPSKRFKVKFAMPSKPNNIAVAAYQFEKDAEKFKKDVIAKGGKAILTKEESTPMGGKFIVRFKRGDQKPVQAIFDTKAQADAYEKEKRRMGFEIVEDAPANATGTAVAGTGDDSSTVVVKKKKELQKNLMRRMGIKEAIDRAIPDLEYPKDEIRERVNQLKELALGEATPDPIKYGPDKVAKAMAIATKSSGNYSGAVRDIEKIGKDLSKVSTIARALKTANEDLNKDDEKTIKPIIKQLKKSVAAHDAQAKQLQKDISDDLDAQPQDKDVKKVKGTQPKKYYKKLDKDTKQKRAKFFKNRPGYKKSDKDSDYKAAPGDKDAKTKKSTFTKKYDRMYGKDEMYYGNSTMHAKPVAKLNPLTRKEVSDRLKSKVLKRKISRAKDKFRKGLRRP